MARTKGSVGSKVAGVKLPYAPSYMIELERRYWELKAPLLMVESVMRHESSNNQRGTVESGNSRLGVAATNIRAHRLPVVQDSFDARPASERSKARPYSAARFAQDVATQRRDRRSGDVRTITIPNLRLMSAGFAHLVATERFMRGEGSPFESPVETRDRHRRTATKAPSVAEARAARLRELVPAIDASEWD